MFSVEIRILNMLYQKYLFYYTHLVNSSLSHLSLLKTIFPFTSPSQVLCCVSENKNKNTCHLRNLVFSYGAQWKSTQLRVRSTGSVLSNTKLSKKKMKRIIFTNSQRYPVPYRPPSLGSRQLTAKHLPLKLNGGNFFFKKN